MSDTQQPDDYPTRDELIAAMQEAQAGLPAEQAQEPTQEAAPEPTPAEPEAPAEQPAEPSAEPDEPKIAAVLRAREKAFRERQEAEDYAAQLRRQAEAEAQRMLEEARRRAQEEWDAEVQRRRKQWEESPTEALRTLAGDPQAVADALAREGTPEWRELRRVRQELEAAKAEASVAKKVQSEFEQWKAEQARIAQEQKLAQAREMFLGSVANAEKAPYLHKRYEPEEIFDRAVRLAQQWQAAGIAFDESDVAEYLEYQARSRILGSAPQQVSGAAQAAGKRPQGSASPRTLSAANGSERRTSPKPISEMTRDEEREALIEEARKARAMYRD